MSLTPQQLELTDEYQQSYAEQIENFKSTPQELQDILRNVWTELESTVAIENDPTAKLAAVSALVHLRELSNEFQPEDVQTLVDLLIGLALSK